MTIHDRALEEMSYLGSRELAIRTYLRAFLNDAELVEKVARELFLTEQGEGNLTWEDLKLFSNVNNKGYDFTYELMLGEYFANAKAALDTIKKEAGIL